VTRNAPRSENIERCGEKMIRNRFAIAALLFLLCGAALAGPERLIPGGGEAAETLGPEGSLPADFTLPDLDGQPVALNRFLGKTPVLLVFWATWCPECKAAIPEINAMATGPLAAKLQVLGLDFRESREKVANAVKARGIRYPVLLDEKGQVARAYGVVGIPTYVLIGRDGKVIYREHVLPADISRYL
jgi:peroxiredoxin